MFVLGQIGHRAAVAFGNLLDRSEQADRKFVVVAAAVAADRLDTEEHHRTTVAGMSSVQTGNFVEEAKTS